MSSPVAILSTYLHLARASAQRQRPHVRDRLLVIAGTIAVRMALPRVAAYCRHVILQHNRQHLLGRWPDMETALEDENFLALLRQLQRRYPQEKAEQMLATLGIVVDRERDAYFTDEEYAASLLGTTTTKMDELFRS